MMQLTKLYYISIFFIFPVISSAQTPEEEYDHYKNLYPDEPSVMLKKYQDMFIEKKGDSLLIRNEFSQEIFFLGEVSNYQKQETIYISGFSEVSNIKAQTLYPAKRKYKSLDVTEFKETFNKQDFVFYDDNKKINFTYPGIQVGTKTTLSYTEKSHEPHFTGSFYFASYLPVVHARVRVIADPGIEMDFREFNFDGVELKKEVNTTDGKTTYVFESKNLGKIYYEDLAPGYSYLAPHLGIIIKNYKNSKGETVKVLGTPKDLYNWYWTFVEGLKEEKNKAVEAIVNKIIEGKESELEKVKAIFYWVQQNIKYIAFEQGMRGFIPHPASYICEKRYGDCKDMATIVINMLHHAGVEAYFTWIGTRDLPYSYTNYPTPSTDNHMIASYFHDGEAYYLDATGQFISFGYPTSMIQGKEALIAVNKDSFLIKTVPTIPKEKNVSLDSSFFKLEQGTLVGTGKSYFHGYSKFHTKPYLTQTNRTSIDDYVKRVLLRGNNKFLTSSYELSNLDDYHLPTVITYDFKVPDYYKEVNDNIYFNMNIDKNFAAVLIDKTRRYPFKNDFSYTIKNIAVLDIPEGYQVKHLPKDSSLEIDFFSYKISYKVMGKKIILEKQYDVDYLMLNPSQFKIWNNASNKLNEDNRQVIIFEKI